MSIGALALGEAPVSAQPSPTTSAKTPPPRRQTVAKADDVAQPEAR